MAIGSSSSIPGCFLLGLLTGLCVSGAARAQGLVEGFDVVSFLNTDATTDTSAEHDRYPVVVSTGVGTWSAVWGQSGGASQPGYDSANLLWSHSSDVGATWTAPGLLSTTGSGFESDISARLASDGEANVVAVWVAAHEYYVGESLRTDYRLQIARSSDGGASWTASAPLIPDAVHPGRYASPEIATDGAGIWLAAWSSRDDLGAPIGADYDIHVSRSLDAGATWSPPVVVNDYAADDPDWTCCSQTLTDGSVELAHAGGGTWIAVWRTDYDLEGTIGTDYDLVFSRSTDAGATWTPAAPLNAMDDNQHDLSPSLAASSSGDAVVVWVSENPLGGTIQTDRDVLFVKSSDAGASWSEAAPLHASAYDDGHSVSDGYAEVATNGEGHWLAVYRSYDSDTEEMTVQLVQSSDEGATWSDSATLHSVTLGLEISTIVAASRYGTWIAAWGSRPDLSADLDVLYTVGTGPADIQLPALGSAGLGTLCAVLIGLGLCGRRLQRRAFRSRG